MGLLYKIARFMSVAAVAVGIGRTCVAADNPEPKKHGHAPTAGVNSLDVFSEDGRLHLLITRRADNSQPPVMEYLRSDDGGVKWSEPSRLGEGQPPPGAHRGLDVQVAASGDKILAGWTVYSAASKFGRGAIATAVSSDGGKTWRPGVNPADDGSEGDHAFLDIAADARGDFHAVWLDSRAGKKGLIYAHSSDAGLSWSKNQILDPETCECCWNSITTSPDGKLFVLYRNKSPRDMAVITSADGGKSWGKPVVAGAFNWDFNGCPHVGGGIASVDGRKLFSTVWSGKAEVAGSYLLASTDAGEAFSEPMRLGEPTASHPDVACNGRKVAAVWDALVDGAPAVFAITSADEGLTWSSPRRISEAGLSAHYPRVVAACEGFRVFWTETKAPEATTWRSFGLK